MKNVLGDGIKGQITQICNSYKGFSEIKSLSAHLDDVKTFLTKYKDFKGKGLEEVISAMKNASPKAQDGVQFLIIEANKLDPANISRFEGNIAGIEDITDDFVDGITNIDATICTGCLYDIMLKDGTKLELKSWKLESLQAAIGHATSANRVNSKFYKQFKQYFQTGSFKYVFNNNKIPNIADAKKEFVKLLRENVDELWEINQSFFTKYLFNERNVNGITFKAFMNSIDETHEMFNFIN